MDGEFRFVALLIVAVNLVIFPLQSFLPMDSLILVSAEVLQRPWIVLLVAFGIGIISGTIPAYRASKLKPVDALRYE